MIRVLLVEDQALVRTGFRMVVDSQPDMRVVGEAGDGAAGIAEAARLTPDVIVMDVRMPRLDGIEATRQILAASDSIAAKVLVLTTYDLDDYAVAAVRAGASGFLLKDAPPEVFLTAIRTVHAGDAVLAASTTRRLLDRLAPPVDPVAQRLVATLTERERAVLRVMARGQSNAEIAVELRVGEGTVKTHVRHILTKLGVRDRVQAVIAAHEAGLVRAGGS
ncbi:response regulator transcription factor [Nocardia sp. NBC_01503]|uniref:response regulator transcription factor n=1 Tax=Nocardia sp. NBC_01503 TaxID=2975997 RepID=UPI002E7B33C0|nr:response regulator transcription factor [Nocardia sp. NBC_01503]WTL31196.1 response regulator transcription factor [Nocardia sp. NBC_01503]